MGATQNPVTKEYLDQQFENFAGMVQSGFQSMQSELQKVHAELAGVQDHLKRHDGELAQIKENTSSRLDYQIEEVRDLRDRIEAIEDRIGLERIKVQHIN